MSRCAVFLALLILVAMAPRAEAERRALLVGCTFYPELEKRFHLSGCGNDTLLVRDLLETKFRFKREHIKILSEAEGEKDRENYPTRAHIEHEVKRLAEVAQPGDRIVIFLAGHGSQQPAENPEDPDHPEPDGLDEIFLPADVKGWDGKKRKVINAITDKELAAWLKAIRARGASLLVIVDACHSATVIRGNETSRTRGLRAEDLVPEKALRAARARAPQARGAGTESLPWKMAGEEPDLVALYAAQSTEEAIEDWFPDFNNPAKKMHGVFTFTLAQVLLQSPGRLTYTELVQRIHARVRTRNRYSLPLAEGKYRDREFLGEKEWPGRSRLVLRRRGGGEYTVNAGSLHGLNSGSILAVYPPAGEARDDRSARLGHVEVVEARALEATVRPVGHDRFPLNKDLPNEGRCEVVFIHHGPLKLRVALEGPAPDAVRQALEQLGRKAGGTLIEPVARPDQAHWLVGVEGNKVVLLPAAARARGERGQPEGAVGPAEIDEHLPRWLDDRLTRIARTHNLIRLAAVMGEEESEQLKVRVELVRFPRDLPATRKSAVPVPWTDQGLKLTAGDRFGLRIHNNSLYALWVTVLFIDSGNGIHPFFPLPRSDRAENRVGPGETFVTPPYTVTAETLGLEHLVVIAIKAYKDQDPVDFTWLCQPTLEQARAKVRGGPDRTFHSPLGQLFQAAAFAHGTTRGAAPAVLGDHAVRIVSFRSLSREDSAPAGGGGITTRGAGKEETPRAPGGGGGKKFPWEPVLYLGGGLLAGAVIALLLGRGRTAN